MLLLFVKLTERWAKHYLAADTAEAEIIVEFSNTIAFVARDREKESAFWFLHESRLSATVVPTGSICYSRRRFTQVSQTRAGTGVHALPRACRILSGSAARSVPSPAHSASTYIRRHFFICLLTRKPRLTSRIRSGVAQLIHNVKVPSHPMLTFYVILKT